MMTLSISGDNRFRFFVTKSPAVLNTRSDDTDVPCKHKYGMACWLNKEYECTWSFYQSSGSESKARHLSFRYLLISSLAMTLGLFEFVGLSFENFAKIEDSIWPRVWFWEWECESSSDSVALEVVQYVGAVVEVVVASSFAVILVMTASFWALGRWTKVFVRGSMNEHSSRSSVSFVLYLESNENRLEFDIL